MHENLPSDYDKEQSKSAAEKSKSSSDTLFETVELMLDAHRLLTAAAADLSVTFQKWRAKGITESIARDRFSALCGDMSAFADHICQLGKRCRAATR